MKHRSQRTATAGRKLFFCPTSALPPIIIAAVLALPVGCDGTASQSSDPSQAEQSPDSQRINSKDLGDARRGFITTLKSRGPAPQDFEEATPMAGVQEIRFTSGDLQLKAWLSDDPGDDQQRPAVVYLHGGWAFAPVDWQDAAPFVDAGFVVLMPMLRAENGNPGAYEGYYGEVDDAIAAGRFVAELPYVDKENVFVAGHSVGAVLTVLAAMMPSDYKAAAALSGYLDMEHWASSGDPSRVVFDTSNPKETHLRNPMAFPASLRVPLVLYAEGGGMHEVNKTFASRARKAGKTCELVLTGGDHMSMVAPSVQHAIKWYRKQMDN